LLLEVLEAGQGDRLLRMCPEEDRADMQSPAQPTRRPPTGRLSGRMSKNLVAMVPLALHTEVGERP
jgi:hypothetical protein